MVLDEQLMNEKKILRLCGEWLKRMRNNLAHRATWIKITWLAFLFFLIKKERVSGCFAMQPRRSAKARIDRLLPKNAFGFCDLNRLHGVFVRGRDNCALCPPTLAHVNMLQHSALHKSTQKINACDNCSKHLLLDHKDILCAWWSSDAQALSHRPPPHSPSSRNEIARWPAGGGDGKIAKSSYMMKWNEEFK